MLEIQEFPVVESVVFNIREELRCTDDHAFSVIKKAVDSDPLKLCKEYDGLREGTTTQFLKEWRVLYNSVMGVRSY